MITPITNLEIASHSTTSILFKFDIHTGNIGGYWLWISYDEGVSYSKIDFKIDSTIISSSAGLKTYNDDTKTYFSYSLLENDYGRHLYFYITATSTIWEESIASNIVPTYSAPNYPNDFMVFYDNYVVNLSWSAPSTNNGKNAYISNYGIYRGTFTYVGKGTISDNVFSNSYLTVGSRYILFDKQKKNMWYGVVENTDNTVALSSSNQYYVADTSEDYTTTADSIEVYIYANDSQLITYTTDTSYFDDSIKKNQIYLYSIVSIGYEYNSSDLLYFPVLTPDVYKINPYLRNAGNSKNSVLNNKYWRILKEILIDKNYYNKNQFAIPYIANETYNFQGYLGVANCKLDVFLNDNINLTVITDNYGNFEFNINLSKGENLIQLQARDYKNIAFSNKSNRYVVTTVNIYTFFSILGQEYTDIWDEISLQKIDADFFNSRYLSLENKLSPLLDIYKDVSETDENFRQIITAIYNSYIYVGFKEGLNMFLGALENYAPEIDSYKVFYNNEFYDTVKTGLFPVVNGQQLSSTGLIRAKYWYAVTSLNTAGEETDPIIIACDSRWWPTSTGTYNDEYKGYNTIQWDEAPGIELYNIYRYVGMEYTSMSNFEYITTAHGNLFVDTGNVVTDPFNNPPLYNITNLTKPSNLRVIYSVNISNAFMVKRKRNWMTIFVFAVDDQEVGTFQKDRLIKVCRDLIPVEIGYDIIVCNDTSVINIIEIEPTDIPELILNVKGSPSSGMILDLTGSLNNFDTVAYGLTTYGSIYYDSTTYEYLTALYESNVYFNDTSNTQIFTWRSLSPNLTIYYRTLTNYTTSQHRSYISSAWTELFSGIGSASLHVGSLVDVQFRFYFNSPTWDSSEYFVLESIV